MKNKPLHPAEHVTARLQKKNRQTLSESGIGKNNSDVRLQQNFHLHANKRNKHAADPIALSSVGFF